jgi:putative hydroxymethylpyrimidine transport system substrate-binding protein
LAAFERYLPYFPRAILARSLELVAPTWLHEGRWGQQRKELLEPYTAFLADQHVLRSPDTWVGATTDEYLPDVSQR